MTFASDILRSLAGTWNLFRRRERGVGYFDLSLAGFWQSLAALVVVMPLYVWAMAYEHSHHAGDDSIPDGLLALMSLEVAEAWAILPLIALGVATLLGLRARLLPFLIVLNWSGVLAAVFVVLPPLFWALGITSESVTAVYSLFFAVLILQMRWFLAKAVLGVSGGVAALMIVADAGLELLIAGVLI